MLLDGLPSVSVLDLSSRSLVLFPLRISPLSLCISSSASHNVPSNPNIFLFDVSVETIKLSCAVITADLVPSRLRSHIGLPTDKLELTEFDRE